MCFFESESEQISVKAVPLYLKRQGFHPRNPEDFGDGGAFPEIHVLQCPLGLGCLRSNNKPESMVLPVTVDALGNVVFDAIVRQNDNSRKIVYSRYSDLIPKMLKDEVDMNVVKKDTTTQETRAAIDKIVNAAMPMNVVKQSDGPKYIKYKPSLQQSAAFNSGAKERIVRVSEMPVDPLDLPKFRHKRVPKPSGSSDVVPVMHSPPRPATVKDRQDWNIPPCISNWKNQKGYTIPLDKRLAADGRVLHEDQISDNFAKLSESLDVASEIARETVSLRLKVRREMDMKEKERKEQELRALAQKARSERNVAASESLDDVPRGDRESEMENEGRIQRENIREERRREREKENRRMEVKKSKITRDRDRDVSEKVALGMANTGGRGGEVMYDQRLFNQEKGMSSGFATDDQYNVYGEGLFTAQATLSTLYRPKKNMDDDMYGSADEKLDKLKSTDKFKPDKAFSGLVSEKTGKRGRPVEFEKEDEQDPFGLVQWASDLKKGKTDKTRSGGNM
ncbi:PREDICTED: SNW/SKI-interacting protein-like [Camelina sativa]|uniref:SNW/SKI-interacting protein-like n=1 Tax=Camelina sativa TaxID=90675 RepID=A0ABM1R7T2_CAMSA|nr:PREDICTED: SNW/SKI-interacting protein-like [Camelina sativa]